MRIILIGIAACSLFASCGSDVPVPTSTPSPPPSLLPLPANLAGIPGPDDVTSLMAPHTPRGELEAGVPRNFTLGHCGLASPIDIDGSLWDPIGGHNGSGGPFNEQQLGELINAWQTVIVLLDPNLMEMRTAEGAVITLVRHDGPRRYFLCD